jgi:predicted amidophosphoribosyltransferase
VVLETKAASGSRLTSLASRQQSFLSASADWLGRYLFPEQCLSCRSWAEGYLCQDCRPKNAPLLRQFPWGQVLCYGLYQESLRDFVLHWKEFGSRRICREASNYLAPLLLKLLQSGQLGPSGCLLTTIPASPARSRYRGHRPVQSVAEELSALFRIEYQPGLLTAPQDFAERKLLNLEERLSDPELRYSCRPIGESSRLVILLDDVVTSGETLRRAQHALTQAGYRHVKCLTLATA